MNDLGKAIATCGICQQSVWQQYSLQKQQQNFVAGLASQP
jgi:hypothetical protein